MACSCITGQDISMYCSDNLAKQIWGDRCSVQPYTTD